MNKTRAKKLIDHIANTPTYNHDLYRFPNGAPADLAAHCEDLLEEKPTTTNLVMGELSDPIRHYLDCTPNQARVPRTRGDEPAGHGDIIRTMECSPHPWG